MKRAIRTLGWRFSADRMVMDYVLKAYIPAAGGTSSEVVGMLKLAARFQLPASRFQPERTEARSWLMLIFDATVVSQLRMATSRASPPDVRSSLVTDLRGSAASELEAGSCGWQLTRTAESRSSRRS